MATQTSAAMVCCKCSTKH